METTGILFELNSYTFPHLSHVFHTIGFAACLPLQAKGTPIESFTMAMRGGLRGTISPAVPSDLKLLKKDRILRTLTKLNDRDTQKSASEEMLAIVHVRSGTPGGGPHGSTWACCAAWACLRSGMG